jgi:hypothetical protein
MPKGIKTVVVGIRVAPTVYARLQQRAEKERRTISGLALLLVEDGLDQEAAPGPRGAANGQRAPVAPPTPAPAVSSQPRPRDAATQREIAEVVPIASPRPEGFAIWNQTPGLGPRVAAVLADLGCNTDADVLLLRDSDIKRHRKCGRLTFRRIKRFQAQLDLAESESLPPVSQSKDQGTNSSLDRPTVKEAAESPATARHNRRRQRMMSSAKHNEFLNELGLSPLPAPDLTSGASGSAGTDELPETCAEGRASPTKGRAGPPRAARRASGARRPALCPAGR